MNEVRTFRAATLHDALNVVRQELGTEAIILQTRQMKTSRIWPWGRQEVVVTAQSHTVTTRSPLSPRATNRSRPNSAAPSPTHNYPNFHSKLGTIANQSQPRPITQRFATFNSNLQPLPELSNRNLDIFGAIRQQLLEADVPNQTAESLIDQLRHDERGRDRLNLAQALRQLVRIVEPNLNCSGSFQLEPGKQKIMALVGPSGVGKSTTVAKLAVEMQFRRGLAVGIVTVGNNQTSKFVQEQTLVHNWNIPIQRVNDHAELESALQRLADADVILIDTQALKPGDDVAMEQLQRTLAASKIEEIHLVLSATSSHTFISNAVRYFSSTVLKSLILTKLDETSHLGQFLAIHPELSLPISYLATGQNVTRGLTPATASVWARLTLGLEEFRTLHDAAQQGGEL